MERRDFLKLSGAVTAGLALAPIDVIEGMAVVSTTAFFVYALQWSNAPSERCRTPNCEHGTDAQPHFTSKLQLNRYLINAFDEEGARAQVQALIKGREGKVFGKVTKVADALPGWVG